MATDPASPQEIGAKIQEARRKTGLSQERFAAELRARGFEVSFKTIQNYEGGRIASPDLYLLGAIASLTETPIEFLLGLDVAAANKTARKGKLAA